jgi:tol-pal system protein YbgF
MIKHTLVMGLLGLFGTAVFAVPAPVTDVTAPSSNQRLDDVERLLKARTAAQHRQQQQLDILQDEVNQLRGAVEVQNHQLEKVLQRQRELYLEIDKRMESLAAAPTNVTPAVVEPPAQVLSGNENEAYDKAVNLILKDKLYDQAIPEFRAFLQNYPQSSYVPNARYWLGQLLFNKQDWAGAGQQFSALVSQYPDSSKRADAMLKLGVTEQERSNTARAKQLWQQLISEYPDSSSSKLAARRLQDL